MEHLFSGAVAVDGFDIEFLAYDGPGGMDHFFHDMVTNLTYDIGEQAFAHYLIALDHGKPITALPIFPSRFFPHFGLSVKNGSGIDVPRDLEGKRVAMSDWAYNPSVWIRGILEHQYGVVLEQVHWLEDDAEPLFYGLDYNRASRYGVEKIEFPAADRDHFHGLPALLASGKTDAVMMAAGGLPPLGDARKLFSDPFREISNFVSANGFVPINTLLTMRRDIADRYPDLGRRMIAAWTEANELYMRELETKTDIEDYMGVPLAHLNKLDLLPFEDGIEENRANIETMIDYCFEQDLISRRMSVEEIFLETKC